ncbi:MULTISPECIES: DUF4350 domain-containing protein [Chryseobacterium]|uniref:DUF4350 domain-containing protein n=1 Tax=Chryseobacterium camelliae TaxID=1265445 RepID=A0ABU0TNP7_9FLAO|nr:MULTISPECIES: DUF4350 domain-containing protein [Chryseobacterium]MDT3407481.1 hypothetical protein [Pseudacidovorax intermedius]MDQ1098666.1 hypothetical protein [Chryseobacterium camelliae]MDQ1102591.1 hypothetical protein [Chryseobacterium sp. SORGH_AS_1048]MDR6086024.1 hypothetical protein [Chryseobacterium sp. SORGH_AS_0909]MDR6130391.1 hypothetical protein [Chryseobacterium sp. SORGH_AS_1175]
MNKTFKIYAVVFIIIMVILALFEVNKKETTDWRKNFDVNEKSPFGLFVFSEEANELFGNDLKKIDETPYDYYHEHKKEGHNILIIERTVDSESWKSILNQVNAGSDAMLIVSEMPKEISDSIGFYDSQLSFEDQNVLKLTDKAYQNDFIKLDKFPSGKGFTYIKPGVEVLGKTVEKNNSDQANFIKTRFGKGNIYVHSEPLFLTNYYLLKKGNTRYAEDVLSYLKNRETVWFVESTTGGQSRFFMRFIFSNPALKYAWWVFLGGMLLFIFFNAKRKQRIVPVIEPLKNTSVDFIRSIGNLYLQEGDFHDMMGKKAQYFLNKVRMDLLIDTQHLDEEFIKKLQLKTGKPLEMIQEAVELIKKGQDPYAAVMREDLVKMNALLDKILKS